MVGASPPLPYSSSETMEYLTNQDVLERDLSVDELRIVQGIQK